MRLRFVVSVIFLILLQPGLPPIQGDQSSTSKPADKPAFTDAEYATHIADLKPKLPTGFTYVIQRPFVVIGDGGRDQVQQAAENIVKWTVVRLKQDYFKKDPADILNVWLFKDKASYDKYTKEVFGDTPTTPFGYYSPAHKALIMNISTGGGTLVHEIVHPFMAANFPNCPPWFNEGMGSLYEQSGEKDGHIVGYTNWRLPGLQAAIKAEKVSSFEKLCGLNNVKFYNQDRGTNYGQARYLCYYLQEKGLLHKFYKDFTANQQDDPTGYKTLKNILGVEDMDAFKKQWEAYVMALKV